MEDRKTETINKVPLLGDIPLIGEVFRRKQDKKTKTELLIFLTPHVALSPDPLQPMSDDETKGLKLTPGAVQRGTFDDHLQGLKRGNQPQTQPVKPADPYRSIDLSEPPKPRGRESSD